jgi:hypothetical protein
MKREIKGKKRNKKENRKRESLVLKEKDTKKKGG